MAQIKLFYSQVVASVQGVLSLVPVIFGFLYDKQATILFLIMNNWVYSSKTGRSLLRNTMQFAQFLEMGKEILGSTSMNSSRRPSAPASVHVSHDTHSQQTLMLNLITKVTVSGAVVLGEGLGHKHGVPMDGVHVLILEAPGSPSPSYHVRPEPRGTLNRHHLCGPFGPGLPALRGVSACCVHLTVYAVCHSSLTS